MSSKARLKQHIAIAVVGGAFVGTAAAFATQSGRALPVQDPQAAAVIVEPVAAPAQTVPADAAAARTAPVQTAPPQDARVLPPAAAKPERPARDDGGTITRARELAQRGDVSSLLALRDEILERSEKSGQSESLETQRELEEIDRCITEARVRRLKIDGEALQKSTEH